MSLLGIDARVTLIRRKTLLERMGARAKPDDTVKIDFATCPLL